MVTIIFMVFAVILLFGMIGDKEKFNKRIYCLGFIVCIVAVVVL